MQAKDLFFVIPTYRLRDVGETVQLYEYSLGGLMVSHRPTRATRCGCYPRCQR